MTHDFLHSMSALIRPHVSLVGTAAVATVLVVYGATIHRVVRRHIKSLPWVVRVAVFVVLCAFGYASCAVFLGKVVGLLLAQLNGYWLAPSVVLLFTAIGILAERQGHV